MCVVVERLQLVAVHSSIVIWAGHAATVGWEIKRAHLAERLTRRASPSPSPRIPHLLHTTHPHHTTQHHTNQSLHKHLTTQNERTMVGTNAHGVRSGRLLMRQYGHANGCEGVGRRVWRRRVEWTRSVEQ